ncbi:MAG: GAF domain-containing protein, partial [Anaerolineae bacterium]|nr:GAF domain-containing protein [Anaerolineae bacterium]
PGLDGYEASTRIKGIASLEGTPIIAFTAEAKTKDDHERLLAAGCDGYIPKSSSPQEFLEQVEAYLQGKGKKPGSTNNREASIWAYQQRLVSRLQEQIKKLTEANERLTLLNNAAHSFTSTLDIDHVLNSVMHQVEETLGVEACSLLLLDEATDELVFIAASGAGADRLIGYRLAPDQGIAGWVLKQELPILVNDVKNDPRYFAGLSQSIGVETRSIICVPLRVKEKTIGVIEALNKIEGNFDQDALKLLDSLSSTAALAVENARLYSDLQNERDQLIRKEEEIRRSIARDLHDGPTQQVSAIAMNVEFIRSLRQIAPERVDPALEALQKIANEAAHDVRNLLFGLHPTILETQGLIAALTVYVERFVDRNGMELSLDIAPDLVLRLSRERELVAFIIIQEAVNNARKHAKATHTTVSVRSEKKMALITIADDGHGFEPPQLTRNSGEPANFGLTTMTERATLVKGQVTIDSSLGEGTRISLHLPQESLA